MPKGSNGFAAPRTPAGRTHKNSSPGRLLAGEITTRDTVEALKWGKLYSRNPALLSLGVQPDRDVALAFQGEATAEQNTEADRQVAAWTPRYWTPTTQVDQTVKRSCEVEGRRPRPARPD